MPGHDLNASLWLIDALARELTVETLRALYPDYSLPTLRLMSAMMHLRFGWFGYLPVSTDSRGAYQKLVLAPGVTTHLGRS